MGKKKGDFKKNNVFTFRADDETAAIIRKAAAVYPNTDSFLHQAALTTALNDTYRAAVSERLRG
jgi:uncharacterized protein (DUF1778 family)